MGKVNSNTFGTKRPKLTVDDLDGGEAVVLTIAAFTEEKISDNDGERVSPCLLFEETGEKMFWMNKTQVDYLIEVFGNDSDDWIGKKIPLEITETKFQGKVFNKLWVAAPERWNDYTDEGVDRVKVKTPKLASIDAKGKPVKIKAVKRGGKAVKKAKR